MKHLIATTMLVTTAFFAASCLAADVSAFVHTQTEHVRRSVSWEKSNPKVPHEVMLGDAALLVPDFTRFWPDHATEGFIYFLSREATSFQILSVTLVSEETHERKEFSREISAASKDIAAGTWLARVRVFDRGMFERGEFSKAKRLMLIVRWRKDGEERSSETQFELKKRTRSDIAWPT